MKRRAKLGQHFLVNQEVAGKIARAFFPAAGCIVEIGPGKGVLTDHLLEYRDPSHNKIIAVELDSQLYHYLKEKYIEKQKRENFTVINRDFLALDLVTVCQNCSSADQTDSFGNVHDEPGSDRNGNGNGNGNGIQNVNVIGNVPYYISKDIIDRMIEQYQWIEKGLFMMQKEFVDKLLAADRPINKAVKPVTPVNPGKNNPQSIIFNYLFTTAKLFDVQPGSFFPSPKVTSTVFLFEKNKEIPPLAVETATMREFYHFLVRCFQERRKTLLNNMKRTFPGESVERLRDILQNAGIPPGSRAEEIEAEDFVVLYGHVSQALCPLPPTSPQDEQSTG